MIQKEKGSVMFSEGIRDRIQTDKTYLAELYNTLKSMANPFNAEPLKVDYLNPEAKAQSNYASLVNGQPHIAMQYTSTQGRIYIETVSEKKKKTLFNYLSTDIYIYTATEYEYNKDNTKMFTLEQIA